jgi:hypothetical protein
MLFWLFATGSAAASIAEYVKTEDTLFLLNFSVKGILTIF